MAASNSEKKRQVTIDSCSQTLQIYKRHTMTHTMTGKRNQDFKEKQCYTLKKQ